MPAILLAQLAVHSELQGKNLGAALLAHSLQGARRASELIGSIAVAVDAIDNPAVKFYERFGFQPLVRERHLYLLTGAIPQAPVTNPHSTVPRT